MKIETFLLPELGSSADRAIPQVGDTTVTIPSTLMVSLEVPRPVDSNASSQVIGASGMRSLSGRVLNAGDLINPICTLPKGLWKLSVSQVYSSNYQSTGSSLGDAWVRFSVDGIIGADWAGFYAAVNPGSQTRQFDLTLNVRQSCLIEGIVRANGVGQEHRLYTAILANKML